MAADWPTYRGNNGRTGSIDDVAGPKQPKVLWTHLAPDQFVASPAAHDNLVSISALGAFNTGKFIALDTTAADAKARIKWQKLPPTVSHPAVSSPAIVGKMLFFGDGMHQTDGASMHAVAADTGTLLWKYTVPGELVHMEGAPTVSDGKAYFGAGHGGVICLDVAKLTLDGKELSADEIRAQLDKQWKALVDKYEQEKKTDEFALPPSENSLPKAAPKLVWQKGQGMLHVDAPVAVAAGQVLVASSYLDKEKSGLRALLSLDAATGEQKWQTPLDLNPWAGATIAGDVALLGGSNIRLDPKDVAKARGGIVAINLKDGEKKWSKKLPGGVVSSIAVKGAVAVSTCTDGTVRAHDVSSGDEKWSYPAGAPLFAGAAIAGDMVYAGDLNGIVHAINLADGKGVWKFDLATASVKNARVYGAPIVHGGKIYVSTCNLESATATQQGVVCIGEK